MNLQAGQVVTLTKGDTVITGKVSGFVLKEGTTELHRIYISGIEQGFWFSDNWELHTQEGN